MQTKDLENFRKFVLRAYGLPVPKKRGSVELPKTLSTYPGHITWLNIRLKVLSSEEAERLNRLLGKQSTRPHRIFQWCETCCTWQPAGKFGAHMRSHIVSRKTTLALQALEAAMATDKAGKEKDQ